MGDFLLKLSDKLIFERNRCLGLFNEKALFIHIPKAAGTTVRRSTVLAGKIKSVNKRMLKSREYTSQLYETMRKIGDHHGLEHARFVDLNLEAQSTKRKFAVIRNPWDRVVSRYFFAKQVIEIEKKYVPNKHKVSSFEEFLEERFEWGNQPFMWHRAVRGWYPCKDYVCGQDGEVKVDILRFENLNAELCRYFSIPKMDRKRNVTSARFGMDKRSLYNKKTIQIVADWYSADIELFGYDFDTEAMRNTYFEK